MLEIFEKIAEIAELDAEQATALNKASKSRADEIYLAKMTDNYGNFLTDSVITLRSYGFKLRTAVGLCTDPAKRKELMRLISKIDENSRILANRYSEIARLQEGGILPTQLPLVRPRFQDLEN